MDIIIDRKKRRKYLMLDDQVVDPMGTEHAKAEKARTIEIPKDSRNPAHTLMARFGAKALLGKQAFCFNDRKEMVSGFIVDVIPPSFIHLKDKGVFRFDDIISIGG